MRSIDDWWIADQGSRRRAKIKLIAKKSIENGEDCNDIPESMRQYLALQAIESGKPLVRGFPGRPGGPMAAYGNGGMLLGADSSNPGKVGKYTYTRYNRAARD